MIKICEKFGQENNLKFSTDPNPAKSKTKCLYMVGPKVKNPVYPAPLQLYDQDLPWVAHATHLGHELHQDCTMDMDTKMKRAGFISSSTDIRNMFSFALPSQVLAPVHLVLLLELEGWHYPGVQAELPHHVQAVPSSHRVHITSNNPAHYSDLTVDTSAKPLKERCILEKYPLPHRKYRSETLYKKLKLQIFN